MFKPALALLVVLTAASVWQLLLAGHVRTAVFLCQVLPQVPFKPLQLVSTEPDHQVLELVSSRGDVVADLFVPTQRFGSIAPHSRSGLILAMGIKTAPHDRPLIHDLARTFARQGVVVLWPRLRALDDDMSLPEEPETFITAVRYMQIQELVDPRRVVLFGFSIGASTGLVAASNPAIASAVRAVIFFGGYYDIDAYLLSLATSTVIVDGQIVPWQPTDDAVGHIREILTNMEVPSLLQVFDARTPQEAAARLEAAPESEKAQLRQYSPSSTSTSFHGHLFILHDTGDPFVPYVESAKLHQAVSPLVDTTYVLTSLFEHVQPKSELTWDTVRDVARLYRFVHHALAYL